MTNTPGAAVWSPDQVRAARMGPSGHHRCAACCSGFPAWWSGTVGVAAEIYEGLADGLPDRGGSRGGLPAWSVGQGTPAAVDLVIDRNRASVSPQQAHSSGRDLSASEPRLRGAALTRSRKRMRRRAFSCSGSARCHRHERKINRPAQLVTGTTRDKIASLVAPADGGGRSVSDRPCQPDPRTATGRGPTRSARGE